MSDLDKKLANDISEVIWDYCHAEDTEYGIPKVVGQDKATEIIVARVKQAFKDAGYVQKEWRSSGMVNGERYEFKEVLTKEEWERQAVKDGWVRKLGDISGVNIVVDPTLMTGQEWYDRFESEYKAIAPPFKFDHKAHQAAKKAAGIE